MSEEEDTKIDAEEESTEEDKAETSGADAEDSAGDDAEAPKKRKRAASAKGEKKGAKAEKAEKAEKKKAGPGAKKKPTKRTHPKTTDMIIEAIENMGEKQGSSYQAIKAYILQNFKSVRPDMVKSMMRRSLKTGLEHSVFVRPKNQANTNAMSGRFLLGKSAKKEEDDEVMPQKSKRAQAVAALKAKTPKKKAGKKKSGKAKKPVAKKARGRK